jgi:menaquinone-dependent protoporphyrinogen IX oxidase
LAKTISESTRTPIFDVSSTKPTNISNFDMLIIGNPVEGFRPTKEILTFIEQIPKTKNQKAIVFFTYAL